MAVFVAFADSGVGGLAGNEYRMAGFAAPISDWENWFAPAWEDRVLARRPQISRFHTTELSSPDGCERLGLTWGEGEAKIEEATQVIASMGSLILIECVFNKAYYDDQFRDHRFIMPGPQPGAYRHHPDSFGLQGFVNRTLNFLNLFRPEAEKVDFVIEHTGQFSRYIQGHFDALREALERESPQLARLLGDVIVAGKDRIPLQAADCACWHLHKIASGKFTRTEGRRYRRIAARPGMRVNMPDSELNEVHERAAKLQRQSPFPAKPSRRDGTG